MAALNRPNPVVGLFAPQVQDPGTVYSVPASRTVFSYWHGLVFLTNLLDMMQLPDQIFTKF
jgi:hypothetical protein